MGDTPFIKFYPSDFLAGTSGLSPAERGCYITLLCLMYEANGPIPRDDARLARRCGAPKAVFVRILGALLDQGKVTQDGDRLSNRRAEKALIDRLARVQNSTHAARQKWREQDQKGEEKQRPFNAGASPTHCVADASQSPEPEPDKNPPLTPPPGGRSRVPKSVKVRATMDEAMKILERERAKRETE